MRLASILTGSVLAALVAPALARADTLAATRYEMVERAHVIEMKVDRGFATLVVQRTVANNGPKSDQAFFHLDVPSTAVATRLRTSGANGSWFEGELMEAEVAAKKYQELTGIGGYYPKDPALLSWRSQGVLALQVFPVLGQSTKTVEYTLKLPLEYEDGAYRVELPAMGTKTLAATIRVSAAHPEDAIVVNGVASPAAAAGASGSVITAAAEKPLSIALRPRGVAPISTVLASVPVAENKHLVHGRIAAAAHLAEVPRAAHVVVLFDASRSHHQASAGLAGVRAYLGHMTGATVDFLTFDREVRAPIGRNVPVAVALTRLAGFTIELRNGSALDAALTEADTILQASPAQGRRVVVVTDTLTRSELTPAKVGVASWKSGAVLHFATMESGHGSVERDDDSPWATLPRRTGGLFWKATAPETVDDPTRTAFEELARPKRLDKLVVRGLSGRFTAPEVLEEGKGLDHFVIADNPTARVDIDGELWSKPLHLSFTPTAEQGKLDAALFFGSPLLSELSEPEQMKLAMLGRAVSPVTSYLAIEPGVRPSTEGLEDGEGAFGFGSGAGGGAHTVGLASLRALGHGTGNDKEKWLQGEIVTAAKTCAPAAKLVNAELETTYDEIVDVVHVEVAPTRDAKAESCLREAIWKLTLPGMFTGQFEGHHVRTNL
jgi:Vault protein inter-alpha-trypsin domain